MSFLLGFHRASVGFLSLGANVGSNNRFANDQKLMTNALPRIAKDLADLRFGSTDVLRQETKQSTLYARIIENILVDNVALAILLRLALSSRLDLASVVVFDFDKIKTLFASLPPRLATVKVMV